MRRNRRNTNFWTRTSLSPIVLLFRVQTVQSSGLGLNQNITRRIKEEEMDKQSIKQKEEEQLQVAVPEPSVCVKTEESPSLLLQRQTQGLDFSSHLDTGTEEPTDHSFDEDCSGAQVKMKTIREWSSAAPNSSPVFSKYNSDTEDPTDLSSDSDSNELYSPGAPMETDTDDNSCVQSRKTCSVAPNTSLFLSKCNSDTEETTDLSSDTDSDELYSPGAQMEAEKDHNYVRIRKTSSAAPNSSLFLSKYKSDTEETTDHHSSDSDEDGSGAQMETKKDKNYVQIRDTYTAAPNSGLFFSKYKSDTEETTDDSSDRKTKTEKDKNYTQIRGPGVQMEADEDDNNYLQLRNTSTAAPNSSQLFPKHKSAPETCGTVNNGQMPRTASGAEEKRQQCSLCSKTFGRKQHLQNHMKGHTGERPHSCPVCKKTFTRKYGLEVHGRTHTGENPYSCPTCKKGFKLSCNLKKHLKTHRKKQK